MSRLATSSITLSRSSRSKLLDQSEVGVERRLGSVVVTEEPELAKSRALAPGVAEAEELVVRDVERAVERMHGPHDGFQHFGLPLGDRPGRSAIRSR